MMKLQNAGVLSACSESRELKAGKHLLRTPVPNGVTIPMPVTTTRRRSGKGGGAANAGDDEAFL